MAEGQAIGRCHLCQDRTADVTYCALCDHWFCETCRKRWFGRGLAFVKQLVGGKLPGCCGPQEAIHA